MEIQKIPINKIKPAKYNPRLDLKPGDPDYEKLKKSMDEFDLVEPLIWNKRSGNLIGGHQRLKILIEQGKTDVEVSVVDLSDSKEKALNLALNKIRGDWDLPKLRDILQELNTGEFDMEITGFDDSELEELMAQVIEPDEKDDIIPEVPEEPVSKLGDLYKLGEHRLLCGDATNITNMDKLMNSAKAKLVFTSPPYNMAADRYQNYSDNLKSREYIDFNLMAIQNLRRYLEGFLFWNISYNKNARWEWIEIFYRITKETGLRFLEKIVWDKGHGTPITSNKQLTRQYEDILLAGTEAEIEADLTEAYVGTTQKEYSFNKKTGVGITNYWRLTTNNTQMKEHRAIFPVALPVKAILLMTNRDDIAIDPFGGSGSTLIASEKLNRRCYMMEIDPHYCDVIVKRWEDYTGEKAELIEHEDKINS